jgi:SAM-dependent methyltransferase
MDETTRYYRQFASEFFDSTVAVDMSPIRDRFAAMLAWQALAILDAGCGSGRDAKAFSEQGFRVSAFDASPELAERASSHCGFAVDVRSFHDVDDVHAYDGIWCCASLLHVEPTEMPRGVGAPVDCADACEAFCTPASRGGRGTRLHGGRRFTDANESQVVDWLGALQMVERSEVWTTDDQRPDQTREVDQCVLVKKAPESPRRFVTGDRDHFLPHLSEAMSRATEVDLAVAFIKTTGSAPAAAGSAGSTCKQQRSHGPRPHQRLPRHHRPRGVAASAAVAGARRRGARVRDGGQQLPPEGLHLRPSLRG